MNILRRGVLAIFLASIASGALQAAPAVHPPTGLVMPDELVGFRRVGIDETERQQPGAGYAWHYEHPHGQRASLFLYTAGVADIPAGIEHPVVTQARAATMHDIESTAAGRSERVMPIEGTVLRVDTAEGAKFALYDRFSLTGPGGVRYSSMSLWTARGHFAKVRITGAMGQPDAPDLQRSFHEAAMRLTSQTPRAADARRLRIAIARDLPDSEVAAWQAYGAGLAQWAARNRVAETASPGLWAPTPEAELAAREQQVKTWKELTLQGRPSYPYMDQLVAVADAGLLREYIWAHHRRPAWGAPPAGLRMDEFFRWRADHMANHSPQNRATLSVEAN